MSLVTREVSISTDLEEWSQHLTIDAAFLEFLAAPARAWIVAASLEFAVLQFTV